MSPAPGLEVLSRREADVFACFTDVVVAPAGPLPPVGDTDAVAAFDATLAAAPAVNRAGLRAMLLAVELAPLTVRHPGPRARLRRLAPAERTAVVAALDRHPALAPVVKALRAVAHMSYYGDEQVMALLGYRPREVVARAAALRAQEGRW